MNVFMVFDYTEYGDGCFIGAFNNELEAKAEAGRYAIEKGADSMELSVLEYFVPLVDGKGK